MIRPDTISLIKESARIEDVVGDFVRLKRRGANMTGLCPFHNEKTPSFSVSPSKGIYKCFGCGAAGDSVKFVMEIEHLSYPDALKFLAKKYGITVEEKELTTEEKAAYDVRESLFAVNEFSQNHFQNNLWNTESGKTIGLSYLYERGFSEATIRNFGLGFAPNSWDNLKLAAQTSGFKESYLQTLGLLTSGEKAVDMYRDRITFPIHNISGRVIGFGARVLVSKPNSPKYINSPENEIYSKRNSLYGLFQAKKAIIREDCCYLVEGYTDVISLQQAGIENVVSSSGTSLTQEQIRLIRRLTPKVAVLYDGDAAGIKASFRGIDLLLDEGMKVKVVRFPEGEDPDSFAKSRDSDAISSFLKESAVDFIRFKVEVLLAEAGNDPLKRAEMVRDIVKSIALVPDAIERSLLLRDCANLTDMDEGLLSRELHKIRKAQFAERNKLPRQEAHDEKEEAPRIPDPKPESDVLPPRFHLEKALLSLLIKHAADTLKFPQEATEVSVAEFIIEELKQDELTPQIPLFKSLYERVCEHWEQGEIQLLEKNLIDHEDESIKSFAIDLFSPRYEMSPLWESKFNILTEDPLLVLRQAIVRAVYNFKLLYIMDLMERKREELKQPLSDEDLEILLAELDNLTKLQVAFSNELSRVIIS
jgi:DNA primase